MNTFVVLLLALSAITNACYYDYNNDGAWNRVNGNVFDVNIPGQTNTWGRCIHAGTALRRCDALYSPNNNGGIFFNNDGNVVVFSFVGSGGHRREADEAGNQNATADAHLSKRYPGATLWATNRQWTDGDAFVLKPYGGDLVETGPGVVNGNQARWNAGIGGYGDGWLCILQSGNMVVANFNGQNWYQIWATNTPWSG